MLSFHAVVSFCKDFPTQCNSCHPFNPTSHLFALLSCTLPPLPPPPATAVMSLLFLDWFVPLYLLVSVLVLAGFGACLYFLEPGLQDAHKWSSKTVRHHPLVASVNCRDDDSNALIWSEGLGQAEGWEGRGGWTFVARVASWTQVGFEGPQTSEVGAERGRWGRRAALVTLPWCFKWIFIAGEIKEKWTFKVPYYTDFQIFCFQSSSLEEQPSKMNCYLKWHKPVENLCVSPLFAAILQKCPPKTCLEGEKN